MFIQKQLDECTQTIRKAVKENLRKECVSNLNEDLKGIVGIYRLRNHAPPTQASEFIGDIFNPLVVFMKEHDSEGVPMSEDVVKFVLEDYKEQANKIVEEVKNTEAALRRFRRNTKKDNSETSTSESLTKQFRLDVEKLGESATNLGVHVDSIPQYNQLQEMFQIQ